MNPGSRIISYGEDGLTLWALSGSLPKLLKALQDPAAVEDCRVFHRPSFGRGGTRRKPALLKPRPAFGEFDAIVATPYGTYLIETKWSASQEVRGALLSLGVTQARRHRIMRLYIENWRSTQPPSWADFLSRSLIRTQLAEEGVSVPHERSRLAKTLKAILGMTAKHGPVRDVVLFMRAEDDITGRRSGAAPTEVNPPGFALVIADCRVAHSGEFVFVGQTANAAFRLANHPSWNKELPKAE